MVTRKNVAPLDTAADESASTQSTKPSRPNPPYPASPSADSAKHTDPSSSVYSPDVSKAYSWDVAEENITAAHPRPRSDSDASHGTWDDSEEEDETRDESQIPQPLRITPSKQNMKDTENPELKDDLPAILRPGPANGPVVRKPVATAQYSDEAHSNPWATQQEIPVRQDQATVPLESNNPFRQQASQEPASSQAAWEESRPPLPPTAPPPPPIELPSVHTPAEELSKLSLDPQVSPVEEYHTAASLHVPAGGASHSSAFPPSNPWQAEMSSQPTLQAPVAPPKDPLSPIDRLPEQSNASFAETMHQRPPGQPPTGSGRLIDHEEPPPPTDPVPAITNQTRTGGISATQAHNQRNEHYQIKHINWFDASSGQGAMRRSPILTQNANGPCPLLALVNALTLGTPSNVQTALVSTLQTREQVSLGLLLDAVFDELMSGRRGGGSQGLPDVSELYDFLLALHTGMNVNPRFVNSVGPATQMDGVRPVSRAAGTPGSFAETREMRLYSTFHVPLFHGWTAPAESHAYHAFERYAQTFEDAQNIQFAEVELEDKLRSEGLNAQEQQTLQDIQTIKAFLNTWPTQLTDFGLQSISQTLQHGHIAILFRNDHFSTIYREPKSGALMTLVTDEGYGTHDEIVWESLVDVNGAASEMFSGDFRPVSHHQQQSGGAQSSTIPGAWPNRNTQQYPTGPPPSPGHAAPSSLSVSHVPARESGNDGAAQAPPLSAREQEDHDLALALQLQEEEEEQQRQDEARRLREQELSMQMIETEVEGARPPIPPRRSNQAAQGSRPNTSGAPNVRPPVNRPSDNPEDPEAPPSYEQAASDRPYRPAGATAPGVQGNPLSAYDALRHQQAGQYQSNLSGNPPLPNRPARGNRRQSSMGNQPPGAYNVGSSGAHPGRVSGAANVKDADERCVMM